MKIQFSNNNTVELAIDDSHLGNIFKKIYRHLAPIPLDFRDWDSPYYLDGLTHADLVDRLIYYASQVSVTLDRDRCLTQDQTYFNAIHKIYEKNYNGNPAWLDYHQHIHYCEKTINPAFRTLHIDYREKAGPLQKKFNRQWLESSTTNIRAGDVFVKWSELGKTHYAYWQDGEPNDVQRMCELIKPWLILVPKITVALEDCDTIKDKRIAEFETWWSQYSPACCKHWNIPAWTAHDIFSVTVFGHVSDVDTVIEHLKNNITPTRVLVE